MVNWWSSDGELMIQLIWRFKGAWNWRLNHQWWWQNHWFQSSWRLIMATQLWLIHWWWQNGGFIDGFDDSSMMVNSTHRRPWDTGTKTPGFVLPKVVCWFLHVFLHFVVYQRSCVVMDLVILSSRFIQVVIKVHRICHFLSLGSGFFFPTGKIQWRLRRILTGRQRPPGPPVLRRSTT